MDSFCGSDFWNSNVTWYTKNLDLSVCFEETVLVWVPSVFLWVFSFTEVYNLTHSKYKDVPWSILSICKLAFISALITLTILDLLLLKFFSNIGKTIYKVEIYTPLIKLLTWTLSGFFVIFNRVHGIRRSGVLFIFWLLSVLCGAPQVRTQAHHLFTDDLIKFLKYLRYLICYCYQVLLLILNFFIDKPAVNAKTLPKEYPIETSGFFSRIFFAWLDPLFLKASRRGLKPTDVWNLRPVDTSERNFSKFHKYWLYTMRKNQKNEGRARDTTTLTSIQFDLEMALFGTNKVKLSIWPALYKICTNQFWRGFSLKLFYEMLSFTNPILLHLLLIHIQSNGRIWHGIMYAIAFIVSGIVQVLVHTQYFFCMHMIGLRIRSALLSAIHRKSLYLSGPARVSNSSTRMLNFMETDVQTFCDLLPFVNMIWSAPLYLLISMCYLWYLLGVSIFAGFAVILIFVPSNLAFIKWEHLLHSVQRVHRYDRIKIFAEFLNGMKVFKLNGWDSYFLDKILKVRKKEMNAFKKAAYLQATIVTMFSLTSFLVALLTFITFLLIDKKNVLTPEIVFVSLTLFGNMHFAVGILPLVIVWLIDAYISKVRLNQFLNSEELHNVSHDVSYDVPVLIENGTFSWVQNVPVLQNINVKFGQGKLTAIVGDVKSGKSSLLSAILGDMRVLSGFVNTIGSVAYVPQKDWIQAMTLRENIIFGKPFENNLYADVVEKCALKDYFNELDNGDQVVVRQTQLTTEIKQKLSLARALYSNADLYLLDAPITAVDSYTRRRIFDEVIGQNGLLKNATRILATHNMEYLFHADKVIVLKAGMVSESGTLIELIEANGKFAKYFHQCVDKNLNNQDFHNLATMLGKTIISNASSSKDTDPIALIPLTSDATLVKDAIKDSFSTEEVLDEHIKCGTLSFYLKAVGILMSITIIACHILYEVLVVSTGMWLSKWSVDKDITSTSSNTYMEIYGILGLGQTLFVFLSATTLYVSCLNAAQSIHNRMVLKVARAPPNPSLVNQMLVRFSKDLYNLDSTLPMVAKGWLTLLATTLAVFFVVSYATPPFIILILPFGISFYVVQRFYIKTFTQLTKLERNAKTPMYTYFRDSLTGAAIIRAYGAVETSLKHFGKKADFNQACRFLLVTTEIWLSIRLEVIASLIIFFTVLFAVLQQSPHAGYLGLALTFVLRLSQTLDGFVVTSSDIQTEMRAVQNFKKYKKLASEAVAIRSQTVPLTWPRKGTVVFNNVSVKVKEVPLLKDINMITLDGAKIGIVGKSGSGKTTLALSIFRLMPISDGEIIVDEVNIATLSLKTLRSRLTIIPQETVLISGSIKLNLDPYDQYQEEDMWLALDRANLKEYVEASPFGLNQTIFEAGRDLPLKIRQKLCLARGLIRDSKILVIDDATSALDLDTEVTVHKRITNDFNETTIITITSRLTTIMDSDKILVLVGGRIAECDSSGNLLANEESLFYEMCKDANII